MGLRLTVIVMLVGLASGAAGAVAAQVSVLARVPAPGFPSNSVVSDGTIYTGTFKSFTNPTDAGPSKVFAFSSTGQLLRSYTIGGQTPGTADAVQVASVDRHGTLYLLDQSPARVVKLDPRTGQQTTWATFSKVPACSPSRTTGCTDGLGGSTPEPDFAAWGPDGSLYVTDYNQDLIWRVPATGGPAQVWFTDRRFDGLIVGPAGIQLMADGHTLMVASGGSVSGLATGALYTLPILPGDRPGVLQPVWQSAPAQAPDGLAIARSGDIFLAEVGPLGNAVVEVSPQGRTLARFAGEAADAGGAMVPFDAPGSVTFDGDDIVVTNESSLLNDRGHWALIEIAVGQPGLAPSLPPAPPAPAHHRRRHKRRR